MKISITRNKKRIPLWNLLINWVSAPQILSILNILVIGLCNSSANSLLDIIPFLTVPLAKLFARVAEFFYEKIYSPLKQDPFDIHHILDY